MTVVSFDMQLYDTAMRLWEVNEEIRNNYIFLPGKLHVTFRALAALEKYIEASGIDQAWIEGGLYSSCTVSKIIQGEQYYRPMSTLLTLYHLYFNRFLQLYSGYRKLVLEISENLRKPYEQTVASSDKDILPSS